MDNFKCKLIIGASADGKTTIAKNFSSKLFQKYLTSKMSFPVHEARKWADAVMVSWRTVNIDNPSLVSKKNPDLLRIILDRGLNVNIDSTVFDKSAKTIVITTNKNKDKLAIFSKTGVDVVIINKKNFFNNLKNKLISMGIRKLLIEAGGNLSRVLIDAHFVDSISIAYFPFLVGGKNTPTILDGKSNYDLHKFPRLKLETVEKIDNNMIFVNYKIEK